MLKWVSYPTLATTDQALYSSLINTGYEGVILRAVCGAATGACPNTLILLQKRPHRILYWGQEREKSTK